MHEWIITSNRKAEPDIRIPEVVDPAFMSIGEYCEIFIKLARK